MKRRRTSTKSVPLTGSPPMPTQVDWPMPSAVSWPTLSYVSVPLRETTPTRPGMWMAPGMMPALHCSPGEMAPGQLAPRRRKGASLSERTTFTMSCAGMPSVMQMTSSMPAVGGLEDGVRGEGGRDEDEGSVGVGALDCLVDRVEHGDGVLPEHAAAAGGHARDHLCAVLDTAAGVQRPLSAGDALDQKAGVSVEEDAHGATTSWSFSAASRSVPASWTGRPESRKTWRPSSALVP